MCSGRVIGRRFLSGWVDQAADRADWLTLLSPAARMQSATKSFIMCHGAPHHERDLFTVISSVDKPWGLALPLPRTDFWNVGCLCGARNGVRFARCVELCARRSDGIEASVVTVVVCSMVTVWAIVQIARRGVVVPPLWGQRCAARQLGKAPAQ